MEQGNTEYFLLHYYLKNDGHAMNAGIFSQASFQLTKIVGELNKTLGVEFELEIEALEEGGIKSIFKLVDRQLSEKQRKKVFKRAKKLLPYIGALSIAILGPVGADYLTTDELKEAQEERIRELQIDDLERERIIDSLTIKNLKHQIADDTRDELLLFELEKIKQLLIEKDTIKIHRSNFYNLLSKEGKIDEISVQAFDDQFSPRTPEFFIPRRKFQEMVVEERDLEAETLDQVELTVRSAVIDNSSLKWHGYFEGNKISFQLLDDDFKQIIRKRGLKFQEGTILIGDLISNRKMSKKNKIKVTSRYVSNVTQIIYPDGEIVDVIYDGN